MNKYVVEIPRVIPHDVCDALISTIADSPAWAPAQIEVDKSTSVADVDVRKCDVLSLKVHPRFDNLLYSFLTEALNQYVSGIPGLKVSGDTGYDVLRYRPGGFYKKHVDMMPHIPRIISCSMALNDDFQGGEFAFEDQTIKQTKGGVLFFPSCYSYPHEILPVLEGTRYSIVTWFL